MHFLTGRHLFCGDQLGAMDTDCRVAAGASPAVLKTMLAWFRPQQLPTLGYTAGIYIYLPAESGYNNSVQDTKDC